ncbi:MAG: carbamoyl-phosphate synthase small subunit [Planctomycetota bacterium]|nr:MAG: carbamoyl-phosphate synthase small subunit [Planctomycetota bacterium]
MTRAARLALADGRVFHGRSCGAPLDVAAEVVFNTSHTGYQEVLTDPSYRGQAVVFTVPILGIYGVAGAGDDQAEAPQAAALVCREMSRRASSWRAQEPLPAFLARHGVPAIEGVDTRSLVRHLRERGAVLGVLSVGEEPDAELVERARHAPPMRGRDLASEVSCATPYEWTEGFDTATTPWGTAGPVERCAAGRRVVVVDLGVKRDILRHLAARGCEVSVVPLGTPLEAILERDPAGVLLSNGPGDPAAVGRGIELARGLLACEGLPVYGVCLGYQLISLAIGAKTIKMKFGHRGGNHPVRDLERGKVLISAHNHGFAVDPSSLAGTPLLATHESLFDGTLEGVRHRELPVRAVQFHPEAGPGPHEAETFFDDFVRDLAVAPAERAREG